MRFLVLFSAAALGACTGSAGPDAANPATLERLCATDGLDEFARFLPDGRTLENTTGVIERSTYDAMGRPVEQVQRGAGQYTFDGWADNADGTWSSDYVLLCLSESRVAFGTWTLDEAGRVVEDHNTGCDRVDVYIERDEWGRPVFEDARRLNHGGSHWQTTWTWNTRDDGYAVGNSSAVVFELDFEGGVESRRKVYGTQTRDALNRIVESTELDGSRRSTRQISYLDTSWRIASETWTVQPELPEDAWTSRVDWEWFVCP